MDYSEFETGAPEAGAVMPLGARAATARDVQSTISDASRRAGCLPAPSAAEKATGHEEGADGQPFSQVDLWVPHKTTPAEWKAAQAGAFGAYHEAAAEAREKLVAAPWSLRAPREDGSGLSIGHSSPGGLWLASAAGGACSQLVSVGVYQGSGTTNPRQSGDIRTFTRGARSRLLRTCASIPAEHVASGLLFRTLTYGREYGAWDGEAPPVWAQDPKRWKRDLDAFGKRVRRKFPRAGCVWKLEPQQRGAPHFHLLAVGMSELAGYWLSDAWHEAVYGEQACRCASAATGDPPTLDASTVTGLLPESTLMAKGPLPLLRVIVPPASPAARSVVSPPYACA